MESVVLSPRFLHRVFIQFIFLVLLGSLKESTAKTSITFIEQPKDTSVVVGKPVSLNCTAVTSMVNETVKYSWQFNGKKITSTSDKRMTIKSDGTLHFTKAEVGDQGEYVCVAIVKPADGNKDRQKSRKAVLTVQTICSASVLSVNPDRTQHGIDSKIEMWCDCMNSNPSPTITWFKEGKLLANGGRFTMSSNKLVIDQLKLSDSGNYHCNASNVAGEVKSPVRNVQVIKAVRPSFEPKLKAQLFAKKSENFKMECKATGVPQPKITWFKGSDKALKTSAKLTLGSDGSLTINNVDDSDLVKYKCQAYNFMGAIATEVKLSEAYNNDFKFWKKKWYAEVGKQFKVSCNPVGGPKPAITWKTAKGGPLPSSFVAKNEILLNSNVKKSDSGNFTCVAKNIAGTKSANIQVIAAEYPTFTSEPKNTAANENGKAKLECSVKSSLPVKITWYKNRFQVIPDSLHKINSNNALVFKNMTSVDQGVYHCSVSSEIMDFDSKGVNLTMNAAIRLGSYKMLNHHKFNKGSEARIYCSFKGAGPITVTWKKMGKTLISKNAVATGQKLTISDIRMEDEGVYECTGSNLFSNASTKVNVSVFIYPKFIVKPNNVTIEEFGSFWVHCNATGYPKPKITFSKETQGGDKLPPRFNQYENGSMYIKEIRPEDKGNYYCIAANIANLLTTTFSLKVITPPGTKAGSKASTMGRTIAIAVGCAAAYIVLVVGLMIYCKRRRAKQQKKEQLTAIDAGDIDNCEADPEVPLQPINGKPANYNKMEFPRHDLEALRTLGNGSYGRAFLARASGIKDGERETMVVVKSLMSKDDIQKEDFWRELNALVKMDSPHVVALLGVCRDIDPIYMIFEQLEKGDLKQYLLSCYENGRSTLTSSQKLSLCSNIVSGMTYLTSNNFVHKDVAARNCMVTKDLQVKIGFLSLSYDLYSSEYYRFNNILIPLRWMAPEAIFNDEFSEKSDVWSYGVLVWEIYTLGQTPFEDRSDEEVLKCIKEDLRLAKPDNCPDTMATIMNKCWDNSPEDRPSFDKLYAEISEVAVDTHL